MPRNLYEKVWYPVGVFDERADSLRQPYGAMIRSHDPLLRFDGVFSNLFQDALLFEDNRSVWRTLDAYADLIPATHQLVPS